MEHELSNLERAGVLSRAQDFKTADAAARYVLNVTAPLSRKFGLEVGGSIYMDDDGFHYTLPDVGTEMHSSADINHIGYHTHPGGPLVFSNETSHPYNQNDADWVAAGGNPLYLGVQTANGVVNIGVCEPGCSKVGYLGTKPTRVLQ